MDGKPICRILSAALFLLQKKQYVIVTRSNVKIGMDDRMRNFLKDFWNDSSEMGQKRNDKTSIENLPKGTVRKHLFFSGIVQGVGFRYRAYYIARTLSLTGWVRNCYDERVEAEVQGSEEAIFELIAQLRTQKFVQIDDVEITDIPLVAERSFEITN